MNKGYDVDTGGRFKEHGIMLSALAPVKKLEWGDHAPAFLSVARLRISRITCVKYFFVAAALLPRMWRELCFAVSNCFSASGVKMTYFFLGGMR
jgi:hypothetical protein